jgi:hypothetical protein
VGGETHFLKACVDGLCGDGLECMCGVCTETCGSRSDCARFGQDATCVPLERDSVLCDGEPSAERVCDVRCDVSSECSGLDEGFECVEERCRPNEIAAQLADASVDAGPDDGSVACTEQACGSVSDPLVLLVVDTSGSMERKPECLCTTASCEECLPLCSGAASERNRWMHVIEALTGTFDGFSCEAVSRSSWVYEYDRQYPIPYHRPLGTQRDDGVLQDYADRVRFGLATFDGVAAYGRATQPSLEELDIERSDGMDGMWSYPPAADWTEIGTSASPAQVYLYPGSPYPYVMNTGIRSRDAAIGALFVDTGESPRAEAIDAIATSLLATRPYGGTPIAAALDDVRVLFEHDPWMAAERAMPEHPRHVVLITDGRPDDDYRLVHCDCNEPESGKDCDDYLGPLEEAADMRCPYPLSATSARALVERGLVQSVDVIGFSVEQDSAASTNVTDIAREGDGKALFVSNAEQMRDAIALVLNSILEESSVPSSDDSCTTGELTYAHGARWMDGCGYCECQDGIVRCNAEACTQCMRDWDCAEGEHCRFDGVGCGIGYCVPSTSEACDAPSNHDAVCGCDGETYGSPCDAPSGVAHVGACQGIACPWLLSSTVEHGAAIPSGRLCDQCTCIDGEALCAQQVGTSCYTCFDGSPCAHDQVCVLPTSQCTSPEEPEGYCMNLPRHCPDSTDEPQYCACDGNRYGECQLVLGGLTRADDSACAAN